MNATTKLKQDAIEAAAGLGYTHEKTHQAGTGSLYLEFKHAVRGTMKMRISNHAPAHWREEDTDVFLFCTQSVDEIQEKIEAAYDNKAERESDIAEFLDTRWLLSIDEKGVFEHKKRGLSVSIKTTRKNPYGISLRRFNLKSSLVKGDTIEITGKQLLAIQQDVRTRIFVEQI